ncbi:MAG: MBL fold metallo-hydrolase [Patescibacteria group bacterium]
MVITFYGEAFVKVQQGETIFAFNPVSREHDVKASKFGADIALISLNDPVFNGSENTSFGSKEALVVDGPGEYEIGGVFIKGFPSVGPAAKINTIYTVSFEGIRLCHLGGLAQATLAPAIIEDIGVVDVLFIPIGGGQYLSPKDASKLAASLEAKIIVPILWSGGGMLETFLKEAGEEKENAVDKLTLKKKDLEGKEGEIVVIKS